MRIPLAYPTILPAAAGPMSVFFTAHAASPDFLPFLFFEKIFEFSY